MKTKPWFTIRNADSADTPVEILLYGEISQYWGDVTAKDFIAQVRAIPAARPINLRINSPGGDVWQGMAIHNYLKTRGNVIARIDGIAASMASVVAMAADKIVMPANAMMMIHNASGLVAGNAGEMEAMAELLDKIDGQIAGIYAARTGMKAEAAAALMDQTTYLTGQEAVDQGFADELGDELVVTARLKQFTDHLDRYGAVPSALRGEQTPPPPNPPKPPTENNTMLKILTALAAAQIIPSAKLSEDDALPFIEDHLRNQAKKIKDLETENTTLQGRLNQIEKKRAADAVKAAIDAKKITDEPTLRARWEKAYLADPEGTQAMLDGMTGSASPTTKKPAGAPPIAELPGDDVPGDEQPKTLDEIRAAMESETDPEKQYALALQARKLRGHENLFTNAS